MGGDALEPPHIERHAGRVGASQVSGLTGNDGADDSVTGRRDFLLVGRHDRSRVLFVTGLERGHRVLQQAAGGRFDLCHLRLQAAAVPSPGMMACQLMNAFGEVPNALMS